MYTPVPNTDKVMNLTHNRAPKGWEVVTVFLAFGPADDICEEFDLEVHPTASDSEILEFAQRVLENDYNEGGRIVKHEKRFGLYL